MVRIGFPVRGDFLALEPNHIGYQDIALEYSPRPHCHPSTPICALYMPKAPRSSGRRCSSASLGSSRGEVTHDVLPLDMSTRRASDAGIKFRPPLIPGEYRGQKRKYNRRISQTTQERSTSRAVSEPRPTFDSTRASEEKELGSQEVQHSPTNTEIFASPSSPPISVDDSSRPFWEVYSLALESAYSGQPQQDFDLSIGDAGQFFVWTQRNDVLDDTPDPVYASSGTNSITPQAPAPTPQQTHPSTSAGLPFGPSYLPPAQTDERASIRIAKHLSTNHPRRNSDSVPWSNPSGPSEIHDSFMNSLSPFDAIPHFPPSSSSLVDALRGSSEYVTADVHESTSGWSNSDYNLSMSTGGDMVGHPSLMFQTHSQSPGVSEECMPTQELCACTYPEVCSSDQFVASDHGYGQNVEGNSAFTTHSYPGF
ncbi:hypothetical protein SCHPADRAFT_242571 [Schizopora paradoxa]|uniref:Uncharacterized protein n=1 Tax=Schizopora paradoxa TaxID=27342 RepID=A0A0H2RV99_9AGAM|nr:hypothetical protein SCHPADRAFT_242571 [Schizopora paradoxa]